MVRINAKPDDDSVKYGHIGCVLIGTVDVDGAEVVRAAKRQIDSDQFVI